MSAGYQIVKYRPEHKPLVTEFQKELWSTDPDLNRRYLEWKYEANPWLREPLIYLALYRGALVGMRGFHEARLEAGTPSRSFPVLIAGDALIAPAHRARGLVAGIINMAYEDLADRDHRYFMSVGGANRINVLGLLTVGWRSAGAMKPMGRVSAQATKRHELSRRLKHLPLLWRLSEARLLYSSDQRNPFRHLDRLPGERVADGASPITISRIPQLAAMAELIEQLGHDGRVRYVRDRAYLDWRFRNPMNEYRFFYCGEERLEGYLVLSRRVTDLGGWDRVYIADFEATDLRVRHALLSTAIRLGRFPQLVTWTASLSEEENQLLTDQSFVPVDAEDAARGCPCVLIRPLGRNPRDTDWRLADRELLDGRNWDVRVLYSMRG